MVKEFEVDRTHIFLYHFSVIYINASPQMATFQLTTEDYRNISFKNKNLYVESLSLVAITRQNDRLCTCTYLLSEY